MAKCKYHEKICERCGEPMLAYGAQKHCPECAKIIAREIIDRSAELNKHAQARHRAAVRLAKERAERGGPELTADEVTRKANAEGLSYGQYSARHGLYDNIYARASQ